MHQEDNLLLYFLAIKNCKNDDVSPYLGAVVDAHSVHVYLSRLVGGIK